MTTTDFITTAENEIIASIKRSITHNEIVRINADKCDHLHIAEWIATFAEEVGYADFENGNRDVWGEFHGEEFRILLTDN
jgi:hypothetical protein